MVYTLLLYSLDPYGQTDRQRNKYTCFAWAGGTFFPVVQMCCVSFWFWREMQELALHYSPASFWFWQEMQELALHHSPADCFGIKWEIVFGVTYVLSVQYSCAVVSVFCYGGKVDFV